MKIQALVLASLSLCGSALAATPMLACSGTEPFWALTVQGSNVTYTDAGEVSGKVYSLQDRVEAAGVADGFAFQITASRTTAGKKTSKAVLSVINAGESGCSDGMSETVYKYHLLAKIDGKVLYGCCN